MVVRHYLVAGNWTQILRNAVSAFKCWAISPCLKPILIRFPNQCSTSPKESASWEAFHLPLPLLVYFSISPWLPWRNEGGGRGLLEPESAALTVPWRHGKTFPTILSESEGIYKTSLSLMKTNALLCSFNRRQKLEFNLQAAWADLCLPLRWITSTVFQKSILCQARPSQSIWNYPSTHSTRLTCRGHHGALSLFLRYSPGPWN